MREKGNKNEGKDLWVGGRRGLKSRFMTLNKHFNNLLDSVHKL